MLTHTGHPPDVSESAPKFSPAVELDQLQASCLDFLSRNMQGDPAHDISHVQRVVQNTLQLTEAENGNLAVTLPAAWLHDCISVAKDSTQRKHASKLAAQEAVRFLATLQYPPALLPEIYHAIEAHSFSANIETGSLEARIVQDADRLEALGAIGIARCFLTGGSMGTALYDPADPFAKSREPDDRRFTVDHFYCKLLGLVDTMKTAAGKAEALRRTEYMRGFLEQLGGEIGRAGSKKSE
ncbi:MAG: HD domain-containing protein [Gammaproteobacteria bacterium]|nr:MAG: HD domain-containing protein [Gammaproteobacteria bacterium]